MVVSVLVGFFASIPRIGWRSLLMILIAFVGALAGFLFVFGDAPLFLQFPFIFNERVMPVLVSAGFVLIARLLGNLGRAKQPAR